MLYPKIISPETLEFVAKISADGNAAASAIVMIRK